MKYLVDTNVFSEWVKPRPNAAVVAWLRAHESKIYVSALTIGELRSGIERLPSGQRKTQLLNWLVAVCVKLQGRVLSFNVGTAHVWGQLKAKWEAEGITIPSIDSQIAATARRHGLTIVTRNTADFTRAGIRLHNPFL